MNAVRGYILLMFLQRPDVREIHGSYLKILQTIFAHKYFTYFGCVIALANVVIISVSYPVLFHSFFLPLNLNEKPVIGFKISIIKTKSNNRVGYRLLI